VGITQRNVDPKTWAALIANQPPLASKPAAKPKRKPRTVTLDAKDRWAVLLYPACRVISESNERGHWRTKAKRVSEQRRAVYLAWCRSPLCGPESWAHLAKTVVTLTHIGPKMDDDNLQTAFKAVRDEIAANIGTDDGDPFYEWRYAQQRGKPGIEIRIEPRSASRA
jgi:hypothetical protein